MKAIEYALGFGILDNREPLCVGIRQKDDGCGYDVCVMTGTKLRSSEWLIKDLAEMLEFRPYAKEVSASADGSLRVRAVPEQPGWFERICEKAGCAWALPLFRRAVKGEKVAIEEFEALYRENGGDYMRSGKWETMLWG